MLTEATRLLNATRLRRALEQLELVVPGSDAASMDRAIAIQAVERLRDGMLARQEDETAGGVAVDSGEVT